VLNSTRRPFLRVQLMQGRRASKSAIAAEPCCLSHPIHTHQNVQDSIPKIKTQNNSKDVESKTFRTSLPSTPNITSHLPNNDPPPHTTRIPHHRHPTLLQSRQHRRRRSIPRLAPKNHEAMSPPGPRHYSRLPRLSTHNLRTHRFKRLKYDRPSRSVVIATTGCGACDSI
jgi:hypothetical protein